jgi:hypothetical protein
VYALETSFPDPISAHSRYDSGRPIITATTMTAMRMSVSRMPEARKGRMSSMKRIVVIIV